MSNLCIPTILTVPSDFADDYPEAGVTGTDISVIQPTWIPPNLKLCVAKGNPRPSTTPLELTLP